MKKIIAILSLISILFSFSSCSNNPFDLRPDYLKERGIVLGRKVKSVDFTSKNGEKITFNDTDSFYTILDKIELDYLSGKKCVFDAKIKLDDETPIFINEELYRSEDAYLDKCRIHKEGELSIATIDTYSTKTYDRIFEKYTYKDEMAFFGVVEQAFAGVSTEYSSKKYPKLPEADTELFQMRSISDDFGYFIGEASLFRYSTVPSQTGLNINELITVGYTLYENYIVLRQTAPFISLQFPNFSYDEYVFYKQAEASDCSIIQEAYCNVETGKIELIRFYGDTTMHTINHWGDKWEVDIKIYVYDIDEAEFKKEVDKLADYVKSNAD